MLKKLLPVLLALIGLGGGIGAGLALRPAADHGAKADDHSGDEAGAEGEAAAGHEEAPAAAEGEAGHEAAAEGEEDHGEAEGEPPAFEYVKMSNQFVVPLLKNGEVVSMVVLSLSLEAKTGSTEAIYAREPKLRDSFLQLLFEHANTGGFEGSYTDGANLVILRRALLEKAKKVMPDQITDVLIADIIRQDV